MKRDVEIVTLKLTDGVRVLRFSDHETGLSLEKRLDGNQSELGQQQHWRHVFFALIDRELGRVE